MKVIGGEGGKDSNYERIGYFFVFRVQEVRCRIEGVCRDMLRSRCSKLSWVCLVDLLPMIKCILFQGSDDVFYLLCCYSGLEPDRKPVLDWSVFTGFFINFYGNGISLFCLFLSISTTLTMLKYELERLQLTNFQSLAKFLR